MSDTDPGTVPLGGQPIAASAHDQGTTGVVPGWLANLAAFGWRVLVIVALLVVVAFAAKQLWVVTATIVVSVIVSAVLAPAVLRPGLYPQGSSLVPAL